MKILEFGKKTLMDRREKKYKVSIFTGGRGASSILASLVKINEIDLTILVNAYDDGLSTGYLRKLLPGMLGPSDIRKTFSTVLGSSGDSSKKNLSILLEARINLPMEQGYIWRINEECINLGLENLWNGREMLEWYFSNLSKTLAESCESWIISAMNYIENRIGKQRLLSELNDMSVGNLLFVGAYLETDQANPQSVYGQTKWEGEEAVRQHKKHIILRTSWVFSSHGQNFIKTILKLIQEKTSLNVVSDQIGTPTSSEALADVTYKIVKTIFNDLNFKDFGTYHMTLDGETNWYRYTCFITDEAKRLGLPTLMTSKDIKPILSNAYPTLAKRPMNSRLDTTKIKKTFMLELPHWEEEVKRILKTLIH